MVIQNGLVAFYLCAEIATGILESYMSGKATFPTYTRTGTYLLCLGDPLATVQPEGGGDELSHSRRAEVQLVTNRCVLGSTRKAFLQLYV